MPLAVLQILRKIVTNKWFWIAIIVIFLFFVLSKYWDKIQRAFQSSKITKQEGEKLEIPDTVEDQPPGYEFSSKAEIEKLAQEIYTGIYSTATKGTGYIAEKLNEANELTDNELEYLSKFYRQHVTKDTWLYTDIDDELMPFTTIDETIMVRLTKVGEKG